MKPHEIRLRTLIGNPKIPKPISEDICQILTEIESLRSHLKDVTKAIKAGVQVSADHPIFRQEFSEEAQSKEKIL